MAAVDATSQGNREGVSQALARWSTLSWEQKVNHQVAGASVRHVQLYPIDRRELGMATWQAGVSGWMNSWQRAASQLRAGFAGRRQPASPSFEAEEKERRSKRERRVGEQEQIASRIHQAIPQTSEVESWSNDRDKLSGGNEVTEFGDLSSKTSCLYSSTH